MNLWVRYCIVCRKAYETQTQFDKCKECRTCKTKKDGETKDGERRNKYSS